jgi:putative hydrolase of the HAD superfamily
MSNYRLSNQTLLIDADDTLWENNLYFEQAIEAFIDFLDHSSLSREQVRAVLDEIELANSTAHGYGSKSFGHSLRQCYEHLSERDIGDDDLATVLGFGEQILLQDIVLLPGVAETLVELSGRHKLVMLTKGSEEEQRMKIDRSGIDMHFIDAIVVPEKSESTYHETMHSLSCHPASTWMIGNSPKSDINPALAAGLNAVFIPHERTWSLEHQELATGQGAFLQLARFEELLDYF